MRRGFSCEPHRGRGVGIVSICRILLLLHARSVPCLRSRDCLPAAGFTLFCVPTLRAGSRMARSATASAASARLGSGYGVGRAEWFGLGRGAGKRAVLEADRSGGTIGGADWRLGRVRAERQRSELAPFVCWWFGSGCHSYSAFTSSHLRPKCMHSSCVASVPLRHALRPGHLGQTRLTHFSQ